MQIEKKSSNTIKSQINSDQKKKDQNQSNHKLDDTFFFKVICEFMNFYGMRKRRVRREQKKTILEGTYKKNELKPCSTLKLVDQVMRLRLLCKRNLAQKNN